MSLARSLWTGFVHWQEYLRCSKNFETMKGCNLIEHACFYFRKLKSRTRNCNNRSKEVKEPVRVPFIVRLKSRIPITLNPDASAAVGVSCCNHQQAAQPARRGHTLLQLARLQLAQGQGQWLVGSHKQVRGAQVRRVQMVHAKHQGVHLWLALGDSGYRSLMAPAGLGARVASHIGSERGEAALQVALMDTPHDTGHQTVEKALAVVAAGTAVGI